jgi:hypothetical protein
MTPCGLEPGPRPVCRVCPETGSSQPSSPEDCAVYQTPPSTAGATSCGPDPPGTGNETSSNSLPAGGLAASVVVVVVGGVATLLVDPPLSVVEVDEGEVVDSGSLVSPVMAVQAAADTTMSAKSERSIESRLSTPIA